MKRAKFKSVDKRMWCVPNTVYPDYQTGDLYGCRLYKSRMLAVATWGRDNVVPVRVRIDPLPSKARKR